MKISTAFRDAFRVYTGQFGGAMKFLIVEGCMTLAALSPALFLTAKGLQWFALLAVPFYLGLMLWARVNAAEAMGEALKGGSLFSRRLADPANYGGKLLYGLKRCALLLLWALPLIAAVVYARLQMAGETDGFTVLRMIKKFGGGDLMTGVLYLALILAAALLLLAFGCAFHSGDRHAFVRGNMDLLKKKHGKIVLAWICSLVALLPLLIALCVLVFRYLPALDNLTGIVSGSASLPSTRGTLIIAGIGAVATLPFLPLRSLIPAAYVEGLEKEQEAGEETRQ